jgi:hypothetical protein
MKSKPNSSWPIWVRSGTIRTSTSLRSDRDDYNGSESPITIIGIRINVTRCPSRVSAIDTAETFLKEFERHRNARRTNPIEADLHKVAQHLDFGPATKTET